jgi:hypothetical protein
MSFDLSRLDAIKEAQEQGADLIFVDPITGEPTGVVVKILSPESDKVKIAQRAINNKFLEKQKRKDKIEDREDLLISTLAATIAGWSGLTDNGKPFEYSTQNAKLLLEKYSNFLEQVKAFVEDRNNFLPK